MLFQLPWLLLVPFLSIRGLVGIDRLMIRASWDLQIINADPLRRVDIRAYPCHHLLLNKCRPFTKELVSEPILAIIWPSNVTFFPEKLWQAYIYSLEAGISLVLWTISIPTAPPSSLPACDSDIAPFEQNLSWRCSYISAFKRMVWSDIPALGRVCGVNWVVPGGGGHHGSVVVWVTHKWEIAGLIPSCAEYARTLCS